MGDIKLLIAVTIVCGILIILGVLEKKQNERNIKQLKIRVNVNGIRGKSTITRMTTAILQEAGYHVVGKTTGTASRMFYWDQEEEEVIRRKPKGVSIGEQIRVINKAAKYGADALVCECMAVRPDYQKAYSHQILNGNVYCIVNVLEDHLDEMGPTLDQLAWAFADAIPYDGIVVCPECEYTEYFRKVAAQRNSKVVAMNLHCIPKEYLDLFDYKVFSDNCAIALGVAKALGIPNMVALKGMLKARPDPGALRITEIRNENLHTWFVNAFAANEPSSTLKIWETIHDDKLPLEDAVVVMNCRPDRVDRTTQFAQDCFPYMSGIRLLVIGEKTHPIKKAYEQGRLSNLVSYDNLEGEPIEKIMELLVPMLNNHIVMGVGNIHGIGGDFINSLAALDSSGITIEGAAPI